MGYVLSMVLQIGWVLKIKIYLRMIIFDGVNDEYDYGYRKILAEKKPIDDPAIDLRPYLTKKIDGAD